MAIFVKRNLKFILVSLFLLTLILIESRGQGDFKIFLDASTDLFNDKNIYKINYNEWYHYYYDLIFTIIIYPLHFLPIYWAKFIWLLINIILTVRIWQLIFCFLPTNVFEKKHQINFILISSVLIFNLWQKNIHLSQVTILILFLCLEGLNRIRTNQNLIGSILISLGITIKILPLVLIPYLIYRRNFKAILYIIITIIIFLVTPSLFIGFKQNIFLLSERWKIINPLNQEHILDVSERSFHSLTTLLSTLLIEDAKNSYSLSLKRNIANIEIESLAYVINIVRLIFIVLTLYFLKTLPFKKINDKLKLFYEISYITLIIPLIFPHQQHYAFFFIFPAVTYLVFYFFFKYLTSKKKKEKRKIIVLLIFFFIFFNSHFILGVYQNIYDHFKTLTYGVILLIPVLAYVNPYKFNSILNEKNN